MNLDKDTMTAVAALLSSLTAWLPCSSAQSSRQGFNNGKWSQGCVRSGYMIYSKLYRN
jgi:hypothetical protein